MVVTPRPLAPPEGLIIELVTPLTAGGALDGESLGRLVARVAPAANALLAGGPEVGEALELPLATRWELFSQLLRAVAGRLPLFFGITGNSEEETRQLAVALAEEIRRQNYTGPVLLADLPLWYHSNRGLPQTYQRLLAAAPLPLILLNLPGVVQRRAQLLKHHNLRTQVFKKLTGLPQVAGLVYQGEMRRFLNYHHAAAARPGFAFYEADEARFLTRPGTWGVTSAGAQLFPPAWQRATRACLHPEEVAGDPQGSLTLWDLSRRLMELAQLYQAAPAALLKTALLARGVLSSATLAPGSPSTEPAREEKLLALLDAFPS
jgi:dihydrodipicolinate synthase/N-acetylneuraminate lyase